MLVLELINLFNAYVLFLHILLLFYKLETNQGDENLCLSNVKRTLQPQFHSCYSLRLCFAVTALANDFAKKVIHSIVLTDM